MSKNAFNISKFYVALILKLPFGPIVQFFCNTLVICRPLRRRQVRTDAESGSQFQVGLLTEQVEYT